MTSVTKKQQSKKHDHNDALLEDVMARFIAGDDEAFNDLIRPTRESIKNSTNSFGIVNQIFTVSFFDEKLNRKLKDLRQIYNHTLSNDVDHIFLTALYDTFTNFRNGKTKNPTAGQIRKYFDRYVRGLLDKEANIKAGKIYDRRRKDKIYKVFDEYIEVYSPDLCDFLKYEMHIDYIQAKKSKDKNLIYIFPNDEKTNIAISGYTGLIKVFEPVGDLEGKYYQDEDEEYSQTYIDEYSLQQYEANEYHEGIFLRFLKEVDLRQFLSESNYNIYRLRLQDLPRKEISRMLGLSTKNNLSDRFEKIERKINEAFQTYRDLVEKNLSELTKAVIEFREMYDEIKICYDTTDEQDFKFIYRFIKKHVSKEDLEEDFEELQQNKKDHTYRMINLLEEYIGHKRTLHILLDVLKDENFNPDGNTYMRNGEVVKLRNKGAIVRAFVYATEKYLKKREKLIYDMIQNIKEYRKINNKISQNRDTTGI